MASSVSNLTPSSSWSSTTHVSKEEFNLFHSIDRELYALLVLTLLRDPAESMQVIALWLWLERLGSRHLITTLLNLPNHLLNLLADEALTCLHSLTPTPTPTPTPLPLPLLPLTQSLLDSDVAPLLRRHRLTAASDIAAIVRGVCVRAMADILGASAVPPEERTMFVTFSKGYPVMEWEVREFFARAYGEACIESLQMQEVQQGANEQSLFARIVFAKAATIDAILDGVSKAKFTINGKHVWMRKFVPKRGPKLDAGRHHDVVSRDQMRRNIGLPSLPDSLFG